MEAMYKMHMQIENDHKDMLAELANFDKTLNPFNYERALQLKSKIEEQGHLRVRDFHVAVADKWAHGFVHDEVAKHQFVTDKLEELSVAQDNLNRNFDSQAQVQLFIKTAKEIRNTLA